MFTIDITIAPICIENRHFDDFLFYKKKLLIRSQVIKVFIRLVI